MMYNPDCCFTEKLMRDDDRWWNLIIRNFSEEEIEDLGYDECVRIICERYSN